MVKKLERCVLKVKKTNKKVNPYAVCKASIKKSFEKELYIGTKIEKKEHGVPLKIARKIAMDHIKEFPKYYTDKKYGLIITERKLNRK